jgi:hypothetical protein
MQNWTSGQQSPEVVVNENFTEVEHQAVYAKNPATSTGLTWGYVGGRWGGIAITAATLTLTNAATNYIVVNRSTGAPSVSTSTADWLNVTQFARVYQVTTAGSVVTATQDHRAGPSGVHGGTLSVRVSAATTSGTVVDLTGIPANCRKITLLLLGVSTNGTSPLLLQLGDAGGVENTGYVSQCGSISTAPAVAHASSTAGFVLGGVLAADARRGRVEIHLAEASSFTWVSSGILAAGGTIDYSAGSKATSAALDRVRLTTVGGTDAFDAGSVVAIYE